MYPLTMVHLFWLALAAGFLSWVFFWLVVPALTGLPWVPSRLPRAQRALEMAALQPDELLADLGCGDGRVLLLAARVFAARGLGVEISPVLVWWTNWQARRRGLAGRVRARWGNFSRADLQGVDVVYFFATQKQMARLGPHLRAQLRPGARVVCVSAPMPGWKPQTADTRALIFVYEMPPTEGGLAAYLLEQAEKRPAAPPQCPVAPER